MSTARMTLSSSRSPRKQRLARVGREVPPSQRSRSSRTAEPSAGFRHPRVWPPVGVGRAGGLIGQSCESPAVALIVGAGLAWTVSMISELSMPWR
jgi:hypothetical protein